MRTAGYKSSYLLRQSLTKYRTSAWAVTPVILENLINHVTYLLTYLLTYKVDGGGSTKWSWMKIEDKWSSYGSDKV